MKKGSEWKPALPNVYLVFEVHSGMQPDGVPCECRDCDEARQDMGRFTRVGDPRVAYRKRRPPDSPIPHGTLSGFDHHSCKCDGCREAKRVANANRA